MIDVTTLIIIMGGVLSCFAWISKQLGDIRKDIASMDKNMVTHDLCRMHRDNCPCVRECASIRDRLENLEKEMGRR